MEIIENYYFMNSQTDNDPVVSRKIGNRNLKMRQSHKLVSYLKDFPMYDRALPRISKEIKSIDGELVFIDIGSNIGDSIALISDRVSGSFLCIEGDHDYLPLLKLNTQNIENCNVVIEESFCAETDKDNQKFKIERENGTAKLVAANAGEDPSGISFKTLDKIMNQHADFQQANLVKIDTDGFEIKVLKGGRNFVKKATPVLYLEFTPQLYAQIGEDPMFIFDFLFDNGYHEALLYNNFGKPVEIIETSDRKRIIQLISLIDNNKTYYYDILTYHSSKKDRYSLIFQKECLESISLLYDEYNSRKSDLTSLRNELDSTNVELNKIRMEVDKSKTDLMNTITQLELSQAELQSIRSDFTVVKLHDETSKSELISTKMVLDSIKSELHATRSELEMTRNFLDSTKLQLNASISEQNSISENLETTRGELAAVNAELVSNRSVLESTKSQLKAVKTELESTLGILESTQSQLLAVSAELDETRNMMDETSVQLNTQSIELDSTRDVLEATRSELGTTLSKLESTRNVLISTEAQLESTNLAFDSTSGRLAETTAELLMMKNTYGWKLILILYKIVNFFLPNGGLLRRLALKIWNFGIAVLHTVLKVVRKFETRRREEPKELKRINTRSKKIAYIGHSYHNKTKSTGFLIDFLKESFDVEIILDESWLGKPFPDISFIDDSYLCVIFFQNLPSQDIFRSIKNENLIFFPMYDSVGGSPVDWWNGYRNLKIVNLSKTLHDKLKNWGFDSMYIQYFPKPGEYTPGNPNEVFFWNRTTNINFNTVKQLFGNGEVKIHIHRAIDPGHQFIKPLDEDELKYGIAYSDWFETREEMWSSINQKGIYVSPREFEGLGVSFLEAMAKGKAVIAVNNPTMNEYIAHNKTGYLFDLSDPKKIDLSKVSLVQKNTYDYMCRGYHKWEGDKKIIIDFIKRR